MGVKNTRRVIGWVEQGLVPDSVVRRGIRRLVRARLDSLPRADVQTAGAAIEQFVDLMNAAPIAPVPEKANAQHYEIPAAFFAKVLGEHRKYSSCFWPAGVNDLSQAEMLALRQTCERAEIVNGMNILELGCGWGSLSLWMARHYPVSQITAVSNSHSQREYIEAEARRRGLHNLHVITCDMNRFDVSERFDCVVSVEMFEHMRNWRELLARVSRWLVPGGRFFMHIFCHRDTPYEFVDEQANDWMSRYFFSGGIMPSDELPARFQEHLALTRRWRWDGTHYEKTANAWLANLDAQREQIRPILEQTYGAQDAAVWLMRWRLFFMACAELFGYDNGQQWWVGHYLFERRA
jgi:cyclopropane-fatty-acyl-phospholipid synthase